MTARERFLAKVDGSGGPTACWPWLGYRDADGYGRFQVGRRHRRAHRLALEAKLGRRLLPGMCACHTCDTPPCCNPAHLFEGSRVDNNRDMVAKNRLVVPPAHRNGQAKLSGSEVIEIRESRLPSAELAARFGVHRGTIDAIRRGARYRSFGGARKRARAAGLALVDRDRQIRDAVRAGGSRQMTAIRFGLSKSRIQQIASAA